MQGNQEQTAPKTTSDPHGKQKQIVSGGFVFALVFFLVGAGFNYFGGNPRILYFPAVGICLLVLYGTHLFIQSETERIARLRQPPTATPVISPQQSSQAQPSESYIEKPPTKTRPTLRMHPLTSLSEGQSVVLKRKLAQYQGSKISLILVGNNPQNNIAFEQLKEVFQDSKWAVQDTRIGMVAVAGANFPNGPT